MAKKYLIALVLALAFLGLLDSWYLAQSAVSNSPIVCDIDGLNDCNTVAQSPYSKLLGIPLAVYGIVFYGALILVSVMLLRLETRKLYQVHMAVAGIGALASVYFIFVQMTLIRAFCIYCIASAVISFVVLGLSLYLYRRFAPQLPAVVP